MFEGGNKPVSEAVRSVAEVAPPTDRAPRTRSGWVGIAANANSGQGAGRQRVEQLVATLQEHGLSSRVAWSLDERAALVNDSRDDPSCRCLVAAGGDGTVSALLNERPSVPMTVLPAGTENLFARHFRIRNRPPAVAETIAEGRAARLDLGSVPGRRFALMAGIGFDADVVGRHHRARISPAGALRPTSRVAYVGPVLQASLGYPFPLLTVQINDQGGEEVLTGSTVFLFNLPRYALGLPFAPSASGEDGLLDLVVFRNPGSLNALRYLWLVFRGLHLKRRGVEHRRVRCVSISASAPVPVQLDGDPCGEIMPVRGSQAPWSAEVLPGAVDVLVPSSYSLPTIR